MQRFEFRAMGCEMLALLDSDTPGSARLLQKVPGWFEAWEDALSRFRENSELTQLNRHGGEWTAVGETLWQVLQAALEAASKSEGRFNPAVLPALEAAGYDRTFQRIAAESASPTPIANRGPFASLAADAASFDWQAIRLDPRSHRVWMPKWMRLDLGGIAKGWAADQAAERLAGQAGVPALLDAGGDVAVSGPLREGGPWPIEIDNPMAQAAETLDLVLLMRGGIATSGRDFRRWRKDGVWQHHIIDPRTNKPAATDVLLATAIAPSAQEAELAAKMAFLLGSEAGIAWIEAHPRFAALLLLEDGRKLISSEMEPLLWKVEERNGIDG